MPVTTVIVLDTTELATAMPADTGFPRADVENDFQRARRRQVLARLSQRLRREPDDVNLILPFDEVVAALGMTGERKLGLQVIKLDTVVGTVDSTRDFDRRFRPTSSRVRERWERLALAQRRGESIPPIDVYRIGELHFVVNGHHRVSIALAMGQKTIDAYVTEILTAVPARGIRRRGDLLYKSYERLFRSRVKLSAQAYSKITFSDPWGYAELGEAVEAWGFRLMQHEHKFYDRAEVSRRWFTEEFTPVVRLLHAADLVGSGTDADAYLTIARERYRLIRTHEWNDEVIEELQRQFRAPAGVSAAQEPWRCRRTGTAPRPTGTPTRLGTGTTARTRTPAPQQTRTGAPPRTRCGGAAAGGCGGRRLRLRCGGRARVLPGRRRLSLGGAPPPVSVGAADACEPESPRVRFWPVDGSKTCSFRASSQSSTFSPSVMRVAGSSLATTVSPVAPVSARPESRASSFSSATSTLPSSWVKYTYFSDPSDSTTSMEVGNVIPLPRMSSETSAGSSKSSGRIPTITSRPAPNLPSPAARCRRSGGSRIRCAGPPPPACRPGSSSRVSR